MKEGQISKLGFPAKFIFEDYLPYSIFLYENKFLKSRHLEPKLEMVPLRCHRILTWNIERKKARGPNRVLFSLNSCSMDLCWSSSPIQSLCRKKRCWNHGIWLPIDSWNLVRRTEVKIRYHFRWILAARIFADPPLPFNLLCRKHVANIRASASQSRNDVTRLPPTSYVKWCRKEGPWSKSGLVSVYNRQSGSLQTVNFVFI